ncbi:MAG: hypothetical protein ACJAXN_000957, partial [Psychromonas sp.]
SPLKLIEKLVRYTGSVINEKIDNRKRIKGSIYLIKFMISCFKEKIYAHKTAGIILNQNHFINVFARRIILVYAQHKNLSIHKLYVLSKKIISPTFFCQNMKIFYTF